MRDGGRQILNYAMPGDLIGLQGSLMGEMQHSIEALSPMLLCVFERENLPELYRNHPGLAYDITWIASREERMLDENLLSLGRRTALERTAYLLAFIRSRAKSVGISGGKSAEIPISQQHVADTLGLSLVHTNKTIRKLINRKLIVWRDRGCQIVDLDGLMMLAGWEGLNEGKATAGLESSAILSIHLVHAPVDARQDVPEDGIDHEQGRHCDEAAERTPQPDPEYQRRESRRTGSASWCGRSPSGSRIAPRSR